MYVSASPCCYEAKCGYEGCVKEFIMKVVCICLLPMKMEARELVCLPEIKMPSIDFSSLNCFNWKCPFCILDL